MNEQVARALHGADTIIKGGSSAVTADELEAVLFKVADDRRRDGESEARAFSRLVDERDETVVKLYAALDIARVAERQPDAVIKARLHGQATDLIDEHVEKSRRPDETAEQSAARLARESDPSFSALYEHLRDVQREP